MTQPDQVTLLINGKRYGGWKTIEIERGIDRCVSSFNLSVTERWAGSGQPWQIMPFDAVQVFIGNDLVLTGYVESYLPRFDARTHGVRVAGHSKTKQIVDCNLDIASGQFNGYSVSAIIQSVAKLFNVGVVVQTSLADQAVANTNLERCETAFSFIERQGRLAAVLICDDQNGNLVLTTAGSTKSTTALTQGVNVMEAGATISVARRFSTYVIKGQAAPGNGTTLNLNGLGGIYGPTLPVSPVQAQMRAVADDAAVPLYRPKVTLAESQLTLAQMQQRVNWQKQFAYGQSIKVAVKVAGFRQNDGTLWQVNQIVSTRIPFLQIDADLLVAKVGFKLDDHGGHVTELELGPVEGYAPDPGEVKLHKKKGSKGGSNLNLSGLGGIP